MRVSGRGTKTGGLLTGEIRGKNCLVLALLADWMLELDLLDVLSTDCRIVDGGESVRSSISINEEHGFSHRIERSSRGFGRSFPYSKDLPE